MESDPAGDPERAFAATLPGTDPGDAEGWEIRRLRCPECERPIALLGDEQRFPQHALLHSPWSPFTQALCPGSGRSAEDACDPADDPGFDPEPDFETLLTLPPELDWRTQPFSHVGGPGSRPVRRRVPAARRALRAPARRR